MAVVAAVGLTFGTFSMAEPSLSSRHLTIKSVADSTFYGAFAQFVGAAHNDRAVNSQILFFLSRRCDVY
jgi:hypothetical protein